MRTLYRIRKNAAILQLNLSLTNISYLKANENYDVVLSDTPIQNIIVLAKENVGVMMINTKPPYCTFAFNEQNMVGAFWDYLSSIKKKTQSRNKTIEDLEKFISFAD